MKKFSLVRSESGVGSALSVGPKVTPRRFGSGARIPCSWVIDCSSSMSGMSINLVNRSTNEGIDFLKGDVIASQKADVQIIVAGHRERIVVDWSSPRDIEVPHFLAFGGTPLYQATSLAVNSLLRHAQECRNAGVEQMPGVLVIMTDGEPDNVPEAQIAATSAVRSISDRHCVIPVITPSGNRQKLEELCGTEAIVAGGEGLKEVFRRIFKAVSIASSAQPAQVTTGFLRGLITKG